MEKNFKKSDLKTGMQVELRSGYRYVVLLNSMAGNVLLPTRSVGLTHLDVYNEDLTYQDSRLDIMKVFGTKLLSLYINKEMDAEQLIWQREEQKPILTLDGVEYSEETLRSLIKKATS